jgi:hypothetical protein
MLRHRLNCGLHNIGSRVLRLCCVTPRLYHAVTCSGIA